jgi:hypothetical protein
MSTNLTHEIDSADIVERLVGITPLYLQNFVQRGSYGIRASVKPGKVRAQRRLFSREDVFGIALAWLLFESGLRGDPLARVLNDIAGTKKCNANLSAKKLLESESDFLLIARKPRGPRETDQEKPEQSTKALRRSELAKAIEHQATANLLVVPIGSKFADVSKRLDILF